MIFIYKKLNTYKKDGPNMGFPLVLNGVFSDGYNKTPIYQYEQSEVVAEIESNSIIEADEIVKKNLNLKNLTNDIVVTID
jgi:hypothetical protein